MKKLQLEDITFKNFVGSDALSEETLNFKGDLYVKGELIAHVSNNGIGGCNNVHPAKGVAQDDIKHLYGLDADYIIQVAAERELFKKNNQTSKFVLAKMGENGHDSLATCKGFGMSFSKAKKKYNNYNEAIEKYVEDFEKDGWTVLNTNF